MIQDVTPVNLQGQPVLPGGGGGTFWRGDSSVRMGAHISLIEL